MNTEECKKCRKCINECPVGAISIDDSIGIDFNKCIHCYHCVSTCPFKAVESPIEKLDEMISINKK
ncbi:4Fe-4S binding protein [Thermohalobacter berrensis]|uniref:4Fe-4S binding protein n=1 Tax=Thermohalobacter berrensis TaxID=99594 RepID=UPI00242A347B|nr:4Fe-4S binding protein [Thermohalobacter berrensis]